MHTYPFLMGTGKKMGPPAAPGRSGRPRAQVHSEDEEEAKKEKEKGKSTRVNKLEEKQNETERMVYHIYAQLQRTQTKVAGCILEASGFDSESSGAEREEILKQYFAQLGVQGRDIKDYCTPEGARGEGEGGWRSKNTFIEMRNANTVRHLMTIHMAAVYENKGAKTKAGKNIYIKRQLTDIAKFEQSLIHACADTGNIMYGKAVRKVINKQGNFIIDAITNEILIAVFVTRFSIHMTCRGSHV